MNLNSELMKEELSEKQTILVVNMMIFLVFLFLLFILVWQRSLSRLMERLRVTRSILGFIPVRVFVHNSKLTQQYEKYVGELMT